MNSRDNQTVDVVQDELDDEVLRAVTCKNQELKESERFLEDRYNALSSQKTAKEAELNLLRKKVDMMVEFSEQQKRTAEEKLEETINELNATRNELSAAKEKLKVTEDEMEKYRQQVEDMQHQLPEAELTFQSQIAVQERNAVANWMRARDWERRIVQQSRENAYLKHRLRMIDGEMLPVGPTRRGPMPGRPEFQKPLWQAPRPVPGMNSRTGPQKGPEMPTVSTGVGVFPHCPGPLCMPYHRGQNIPGFPPPPPAPHWGTWGPRPHRVPPPHGLPFHSEACGAQGDNSSPVPKKVPVENQLCRWSKGRVCAQGLAFKGKPGWGPFEDAEVPQDTHACAWLFAHTEQWAGAIVGKEVSLSHNGRRLSLTVVHVQHPPLLFWEG
ncbi:transport and Golgi organization protein 1 homolog [Neovison vison]|uniref:transport and Golgi organization protein 1 homolog n=1 Tax=Neovison vison TaxID=452646 RepID=UPI001CF0BED0|nr:transport and Golgi organization protein 1 homolog [Neogale vison]